MGDKVKARAVQYNHIYYENEVVLLGVDKDITKEELTILDVLEDKSLQVYDGLAEKILELKDLQDTGTCSAHFIREVVLSDIVLEHLRQTVQYVQAHEAEFVQAVMDKSMADQKREVLQKRRELAQAERRISDLDMLFQRIYEDNISGKLSDERFSKLSKSYEDEQRALSEKAKALHVELDKEQAQAVNVAQFIALVKKYNEIDTLTPALVNEFIIGGLGEAVCAVIAKNGIACPVERVGVNDEFGHSGPAGALLV